MTQIEKNSHLYHQLVAIRGALARSTWANDIILLPVNSYHVTILNGVNETLAQRQYGFFPEDMPLKSSIFDVHQHFYKKLKAAYESGKINITPIQFKITGIETKNGFSLMLEPATVEDNQSVWRLREAFIRLLKIKRPSCYQDKFHISMAYLYKEFTSEEKKAYQDVANAQCHRLKNRFFTIRHIEFVIFSDMLSYSSLLTMNLN